MRVSHVVGVTMKSIFRAFTVYVPCNVIQFCVTYELMLKFGMENKVVFLLCFSTVSVGFEYETCPSQILWEKRTAVLQGYELLPSNLGGWSLDKHHALNIASGTTYSLLNHT